MIKSKIANENDARKNNRQHAPQAHSGNADASYSIKYSGSANAGGTGGGAKAAGGDAKAAGGDAKAAGGGAKAAGGLGGEVKTDRRIKKTKQSIQQALLRLMNEKPIEKITVSELAAEADVNRKTFYNHYESVQNVRNELDKSFIDLIISTICDIESSASDSKAFLREFIGRIVDIIEEEPASARFLFTSGELSYLADQIKKTLRPRLIEATEHEQVKASSVIFYIEYIGNGTLAVLKTWVTSEFLVPSDEIKEILIELVKSTIPEKYQLAAQSLEYNAAPDITRLYKR